MSWHALPSVPQMSHWYLNVTVPVPFQLPGFAVSVPPALVSPLIDGATVLVGPDAAAAAIFAVGALSAALEPSLLLPITLTRAALPWSELANLYVCDVAPEIA